MEEMTCYLECVNRAEDVPRHWSQRGYEGYSNQQKGWSIWRMETDINRLVGVVVVVSGR